MTSGLTRRALLGLAAGTLAACTAPEPRKIPPATPTTGTATGTTGTTPATSAPPTAATSTPAAAPTDIAAKYKGVQPTSFGLTVPGVINRLPTSDPVVALTFDACGGPTGSQFDAALIATLRSLNAPATLFLNARWIDANPATFAELAADPLFDIANHGTRHLPLSVAGRAAYGIAGTRDAAEVVTEVSANHAKLTDLLGREPSYFRSGTAHYDNIATKIVADIGEIVVGFDVNADGGARFSPAQVRAAMAAARPGSIVIGHMNNPGGGTAAGIAAAIPALRAAGLRVAPLRDHLTR